jgi:PAS domain S-box-containing protein
MEPDHATLSAYLELAEAMVLVLDADSSIRLINRKGCELLGYRPEELHGRNWYDTCIPERLRRDMQAQCLQIMNGEIELPAYFDSPVLTRDGTERLFAWRTALLTDESGRTTGTVSVCEDITERKQADRRVQQQLDELRRWQAVVLGREDRIRELKQEVNELLTQLGQPRRYDGNGVSTEQIEGEEGTPA